MIRVTKRKNSPPVHHDASGGVSNAKSPESAQVAGKKDPQSALDNNKLRRLSFGTRIASSKMDLSKSSKKNDGFRDGPLGTQLVGRSNFRHGDDLAESMGKVRCTDAHRNMRSLTIRVLDSNHGDKHYVQYLTCFERI